MSQQFEWTAAEEMIFHVLWLRLILFLTQIYHITPEDIKYGVKVIKFFYDAFIVFFGSCSSGILVSLI